MTAQHSICTPDLQRKFLEILSDVVEKNDVPMQQVAFSDDRIKFNEEKQQKYGTLLDWDSNEEHTCDLAEPDKVDERRKAFGLPPFKQALYELRKEVQAEGGKPPKTTKNINDPQSTGQKA
jgi:hypothetical protein